MDRQLIGYPFVQILTPKLAMRDILRDILSATGAISGAILRDISGATSIIMSIILGIMSIIWH